MGKEYDYDADYEVDAALFDCYDPGCKAFCKKYECESLYNYDDYDGGTTSCKKQPPKEECTNGKDDDFDGKIDCQDSNCDQNKCGKLQDTFCTEYSCKIGLVCLDSNYNVKMCLKPKGGSCSHPDECGKGFSCVNGVCSLKGVGESCNFNGDCDSGFCEGGKCVGNEGDLCKAPSECKKGLSCLTIGGKLVCADASKVSKDDTDGDGVLDAFDDCPDVGGNVFVPLEYWPSDKLEEKKKVHSKYSKGNNKFKFKGCKRGDFNIDGVLDSDDLGDWLNEYWAKKSLEALSGDMNQDGFLDSDDLGDWLNSYWSQK